jgi:ribulose-5-phosphate 4-epimerase/fuculose-1-phosphate aldolase
MDNGQLKQGLVDAIRMMEQAKLVDYNGHCSVRVPGTNRILINSGSCSRSALTVEDIVTMDLDGNVIEGKDSPPLEYHIHTEIYKRRTEIQSVARSIPQWAMYFSMTGTPLEPVIVQGALLGQVQTFPKVTSINTEQLGSELADTLGENKVILIKSHGAVTVGQNLVESFALSIYMEENARRYYNSTQLGKPYILNEHEVQAAVQNLWKPFLLQRVWNYYYSKLGNE